MLILPPCHRLVRACASLASGLFVVVLGCGPSLVSAQVPNSPSRSQAPRVDGAVSASASAPASVAVSADTDPLDHLRRRLAEKLGGRQKPDVAKNDDPPVVRIVNKSEPETAHAAKADAQAARRESRSRDAGPAKAEAVAEPAQTQAARLAAAYRAGRDGGPSPGVGKAGAHATQTPHWDYEGAGGPSAWGELRPEFATCASGKRQSPIDIRDGLKLELEPVHFNYLPSAIRVIDNGHTVQVDVGAGNTIEVMGRRFELVQFHFHRPSEERIDGRRFDMVVHLVHKDLDGRLAVVAVLLSRGAAQPLIQTVWNNLPLEKGMDQPVRDPVDLNALLPTGRDYFTYMGSLTTPPCTEDVLWMVMKTPVEISAEQIGIFTRLYPMNARPVQSASGRLIKESN